MNNALLVGIKANSNNMFANGIVYDFVAKKRTNINRQKINYE